MAVCYLVGLDWTISGRFQELREKEKASKELRKVARSGELGRYFGNAAELRTRLAEDRAARLRAQLDAFRVVPECRDLEREASDVTGRIDDLNVENVVDHDLIRELRASLATEHAPESRDLEKVYREAGIVLPDLPRRRVEAVERFHRAVIENRRAHLGGEIESAERRIAERDRRKNALDRRRTEIMGLLKSGGALEHYTRMREEPEGAGFHYIVTMNSDSVPTEGFTDGFDVQDHFVETRLTDATETGACSASGSIEAEKGGGRRGGHFLTSAVTPAAADRPHGTASAEKDTLPPVPGRCDRRPTGRTGRELACVRDPER